MVKPWTPIEAAHMTKYALDLFTANGVIDQVVNCVIRSGIVEAMGSVNEGAAVGPVVNDGRVAIDGGTVVAVVSGEDLAILNVYGLADDAIDDGVVLKVEVVHSVETMVVVTVYLSSTVSATRLAPMM
ncbi:hypothetical protein NDU88_005689 [Pleurodeles waltl]|uniref:Uncharacterized protein n=1 Tax=Pleurodeles waltl TaxID=8319 RepID=A0AAV7TC12_PLEWA|nr:hypothetical protein NDU88_005689 [Pleurodeles waltl]